MTISTPQPAYVDETQRVVEEALATDESAFKLVPTPADWLNVRWQDRDRRVLECPVCFSIVSQSAVDEHTNWHEKLANILQMLAGN
jgi:hypothetical protein